MSQVSKFERVLSPINVTSNLQFNFSTLGPGPGAEQAGQWMDVHFYWLAPSISPHRALHELGRGGGLLPNDLRTPSHRFDNIQYSFNLHFGWCFRWFSRVFTRISEAEEHIWRCLDRSSPVQASDSVHLDVSWQLCAFFISDKIFRNDFDWSEVSLAPGDGWGEYVEEYETSLCVSLDIDHGYRWDTRWAWAGNCNFVIWDFRCFRYCQGVMVTGSVCQIERK